MLRQDRLRQPDLVGESADMPAPLPPAICIPNRREIIQNAGNRRGTLPIDPERTGAS